MSKASDRVYHFIRNAILDGTLLPAAQIREDELATSCNVSRTPVREALLRLEGERLIERERNRSFVRVWSKDAMRHVFALRLMVEPYVAEQAALAIEPAAINRLRRANALYEQALDKSPPDIAMIVAQNNLFHETLLAAAGSDVLDMILPRLVAVPIVPRSLQRYDRAQLEKALMEHRELILALEARDAEWANVIMKNHIHRARRVYFSE
ncbi:MAG: GntR family transcriptional regulator [Novosphingobium sp.]